MRIGMKTKLGAAAAFGAAALLALGAAPASASAPSYVTIGSGSCVAVQEIQQQWVNGAWHDFMENNPIQASATDPYWCHFTLIDNGTQIWESHGAGSNWWYDGPGHSMQACAERWYNGTLLARECGPLN